MDGRTEVHSLRAGVRAECRRRIILLDLGRGMAAFEERAGVETPVRRLLSHVGGGGGAGVSPE